MLEIHIKAESLSLLPLQTTNEKVIDLEFWLQKLKCFPAGASSYSY